MCDEAKQYQSYADAITDVIRDYGNGDEHLVLDICVDWLYAIRDGATLGDLCDLAAARLGVENTAFRAKVTRRIEDDSE